MRRLRRHLNDLLAQQKDHMRSAGRSRRRLLLEVAFVSVLLGAALLSAALLTPYDPALERAYEPTADSQYYRARVEAVGPVTSIVRLLDGPRSKQLVTIDNPDNATDYNGYADTGELRAGEAILLTDANDGEHVFVDHYRIPWIVGMVVVFAALVVAVGGRQGAASVLGLVVTVMVIGWFIVPLILGGRDPLLVSIIGAYVIALVSITVAHGLKPWTVVSVLCVAVILAFIAIITNLVVLQMRFSGVIDEAIIHFLGERPEIDMVGILIGGMIIASLGALDDIVTTQVAAVDELLKANPGLRTYDLFQRGMSVGREHVSALVNTLVLVYVGAALPILIALSLHSSPLVDMNNEYIATEITRTLVASMGLVMAVPISTAIAAGYFRRRQSRVT